MLAGAKRPHSKDPRGRSLGAGLVLCLSLGCGVEEGTTSPGPPVDAPAQPTASEPVSEPVALVVWESNRDGAWRLWHRRLGDEAESAAQVLSRNEPGRRHCCPHIAPDGRSVAYLALKGTRAKYGEAGDAGELRLLSLDGEERVLADEARTYFENRAAVWRSDRELIFIGGDGRTRLLDVASGEIEVLVEKAPESRGWLIDPTLSRATNGRPTFSHYDREARRVEEQPRLGGCQPTFSYDGRWGLWIAGAGGPIEAIDLTLGGRRTIVRKRDPRLPEDAGYLYFPNLSPDNRWLAYAASDGDHDHFESDYEVYVLELEPSSLTAIGQPIRVTRDAATDRFPDVWVPPLPLGRRSGEAPLTVSLSISDAKPDATAPTHGVHWDFGDGKTTSGAPAVDHTYSAPGRFVVRATLDDAPVSTVLEGEVMVREAEPPRVLETRLRGGGRAIELRFDEPLRRDPLVASLAGEGPLPTIEGTSLEDGGTTLRLELDRILDRPARLRLEGVEDRRPAPNRAAAIELEVEPAAWPVRPDRSLFAWQAADRPNFVFDPEIEGERASLLEPSGRAYLDRSFRAVLAGGTFAADAETGTRLSRRIRDTNEVSLEVSLTPAAGRGRDRRVVVAMAAGARRRNLVIAQYGRRLVAELRVGRNNPPTEGAPPIELGRLDPGEPAHLVFSYSPGDLRVYRDGEAVEVETTPQGGFFHWREIGLTVGAETKGGGPGWRGTVWGLAIWDRALAPDEAREAFARSRGASRTAEAGGPGMPSRVPWARVRARRLAGSTSPSLREIEPYRDALRVAEYRIEELLESDAPAPEGVVAGTVVAGSTVRVVERALLDGEPIPPPSPDGMTLEPFDAQPQLEGQYLSDTLDSLSPATPLLFAVDPP